MKTETQLGRYVSRTNGKTYQAVATVDTDKATGLVNRALRKVHKTGKASGKASAGNGIVTVALWEINA